MSTPTTFPGNKNTPVSTAGTGVRSVWGASVVTGPIIVQRAMWGPEPFGASPESGDVNAPLDANREPTWAA